MSISDYNEKYLREFGAPLEKIHKHPVGIDLTRYNFIERAAPASGPIKILSVGRLVKEKGIAYKVGKFFFKANGRARAMGCEDGFVKFCADAKTDRLLGAHIVGPMASELIAEIAIAFEFGASAEDIARSVHAHPTLAEVIKEAALDVDGRAIHG